MSFLEIPASRPSIMLEQPVQLEARIWPYRLLLILLNLLALAACVKKQIGAFLGLRFLYNSALVDGSSVHGRAVRDTAGSWRAMETVYDFMPGAQGNHYERIADFLAMNLRQAQAARNRLRLTTHILEHAVADQHHLRGEPVRILSLAAGSGRDVIEAIVYAKAHKVAVEALLIDLDPEALAYAQTRAEIAGVGDKISVRAGDVRDFPLLAGQFRPHIVEMIGLSEYLEDDAAVEIFRLVRDQLASDGFFITSQNAGGEGFFLRNVANWRMRFRPPEQASRLLAAAGFGTVSVAREPQRIQAIFLASKSGESHVTG